MYRFVKVRANTICQIRLGDKKLSLKSGLGTSINGVLDVFDLCKYAKMEDVASSGEVALAINKGWLISVDHLVGGAPANHSTPDTPIAVGGAELARQIADEVIAKMFPTNPIAAQAFQAQPDSTVVSQSTLTPEQLQQVPVVEPTREAEPPVSGFASQMDDLIEKALAAQETPTKQKKAGRRKMAESVDRVVETPAETSVPDNTVIVPETITDAPLSTIDGLTPKRQGDLSTAGINSCKQLIAADTKELAVTLGVPTRIIDSWKKIAQSKVQ